MECPVKKEDKDTAVPSQCPVGGSSASVEAKSQCPVGGSSAKSLSSSGGGMFSFLWGSSSPSSTSQTSSAPSPDTNINSGVTGYNNAANDMEFSQVERRPGQKEIMSTTRTLSGIPKSDFNPSHQPKGQIKQDENDENKWVYPSEQQYYNAMIRKGYSPPEKDIGAILAIHNSVNERGWKEVMEWETFRGLETPKLKKFEGRPKDLSPKAQILKWFGCDPPFDRHDWYVERDNGKEVRYIIDFYHVPNRRDLPVHLDVRPALDSPSAFVDRAEMQFRKVFQSSSLPRPPTGEK